VLVLATASEQPAPGIITRLEHEYSLRDELDSDWAVRPLTLIRREGRPMLLLEDPGGEPLDRLLGQPMELSRFLRFVESHGGRLSAVSNDGHGATFQFTLFECSKNRPDSSKAS
jgi:hypothetical protein